MTTLLLAGAGHAHAQVLRDWARAPVPGVDLLVVSPQPQAPYSGRVPAWLAGRLPFERIVIDFAALCDAAGARWVPGALAAVDADRRRAMLDDGRVLRWDLLSLNVGSTLDPPVAPASHRASDLASSSPSGAQVLTMRPLASLHAAWPALLDRWRADRSRQPYTVAAAGGGPAGFESLLAALAHLRRLRPDRPVHGRLYTRDPRLLPGLSSIARRAAGRVLAGAGVALFTGTDGRAALADSDLLLWATGAQPHAWQRDPARLGGLAVAAGGFITIDACLRSTSHPEAFAVGDCAQMTPPLPKAGVFAVRMGPVLAANLRAALGRGGWRRYRPQRHHLALLDTADGSAIASRGPLGARGRWVRRWKDHVDRVFIEGFERGADPSGARSHRP